jgi:16S rRNA C967 or C1407 C5-methylase (RsmB/RsmF family)
LTALQLCLAALRALRVGGRLVYSTCSIAPLQNDEVVKRLLHRCGPEVAQVLPALEVLQRMTAEAGGALVGGPIAAEVLGMEATQHGAICLPDRRGWGPIYVAVVEKVGKMTCMGAVVLLRPQQTGHSEDEDGEEEGRDGPVGGADDP